MNTINDVKCKIIVGIFIFQVLLNWVFVAWIQTFVISNASTWLTILPLFGYFYIVFTILASIELLHRTKLGLALAYSVIMFGIICAVISYTMVHNQDPMFSWIITPLITVNFFIIFYLTLNQSHFNSD